MKRLYFSARETPSGPPLADPMNEQNPSRPVAAVPAPGARCSDLLKREAAAHPP